MQNIERAAFDPTSGELIDLGAIDPKNQRASTLTKPERI